MAETKNTSTRRTSYILNLVAFIAVVIIGVALILGKIGIGAKLSSALMTIAQILAYSIVAIISSFWICSKRNVWLWVTWAVSVVLIIISFIL